MNSASLVMTTGELQHVVELHNEAIEHIINAASSMNDTVTRHQQVLENYLQMFDMLEARITELEGYVDHIAEDHIGPLEEYVDTMSGVKAAE